MTAVRYGAARVEEIPAAVAETGARSVLLLCGATSFASCGAERIVPGLRGVARVRRWDDFSPNPDITELARGLAVARRERPELVLGIGGGSTLDMAKLLCAFQDTAPAELDHAVRADRCMERRAPGLILAPTTCGSGSEATGFAVLYAGGEKFSISGPALRPDLVFLDPLLTVTAGPRQRAISGLDALAHAIESLWAVGATAESRAYARLALRLLLSTLPDFVLEPSASAARAMSVGSHLAGRAIDISKTTAAHALSYALTARYGVGHGHAVALTLGGILERHATAEPERLRSGVSVDAHTMAVETVLDAFGASDASTARKSLESLLPRFGLAARLREVGVPDLAEAGALAAAVNAQRLANNPVPFARDELAGILAEAW